MQKKIVAGIASGSMLVVGLSAFGVNEAMAKDVTLSVDGVPTDVRTYAGTVGEALDKQGIQVGDKDVVAPAVDTRLTEDTEISVQYARPVTVTIDGKEQTIWTTATSVEQVLHILELDAEDALSTSRSATIGRDGLEFDVTTNKNVTLKVDGRVEKPRNDELDTSARTVADLLKEHKVTTDDDDVVKPALNTVLKEGTVVDVTIVDPEADKREAEEKAAAQRAAEEKVAAERAAEQEAAAEREAAQQSKAVSTSSEADDDSSSSDSTSSASNSSSSSASSQKSSAPKSSASSSSSSSSKSSSGSSKSSGSSSSSSKSSSTKSSSPKPSKSSAPKKSSSSSSASTSTWDALAKCESGGNWSINTGNGYYGGLQFSPSSWRAAGGSGMPHQASKAEQIRVAENLKAKQGWGAWPACSAKLGLR